VTELSGLWSEDDESQFRVGKKKAGRSLDGVEHNGFPVDSL